MLRLSVALCGAALMLATIAALPAGADELPVRKSGLWEVKGPYGITTTQCTDPSVDRLLLTGGGDLDMLKSISPNLRGCPKVGRTATGYTFTASCEEPFEIYEFTGDFNSAYSRKLKSGDPATMVEARWVSACPADWKPGEVAMFDGTRINVKEMMDGLGALLKLAPR